MISAFQSCEFGFSLELNESDLKTVSEWHHGKKYHDESAAKGKRGTIDKMDLPSNPFIIEFEYSAANEEYCTYDHMVLQLDDCVDCLKCLHPEFDYLFLFDHSCGHDRQREDSLNAENMSEVFGGKQSKLQHTLIKEERGYLGPFSWILNLGDVQHMIFQPSDPGPFWFNEREKEENQKDKVIEG